MEPLQRLQKAIADLKRIDPTLTHQEIMKEMRFQTPGYLTHIMTGRKPISEKFLNKLEDRWFISKEWILHGDGEEFLAPLVYYNMARANYHLPPNIRGKERLIFTFLIDRLAKFEEELHHLPEDQARAEIYTQLSTILK
jgi:hypothetical protein